MKGSWRNCKTFMFKRVILMMMVLLQATWFALLAPLHHHPMQGHVLRDAGAIEKMSLSMDACAEHGHGTALPGETGGKQTNADDCSICHLIATTVIPADHKLDLTLLELLEIKPVALHEAATGVEQYFVLRGRDPPILL